MIFMQVNEGELGIKYSAKQHLRAVSVFRLDFAGGHREDGRGAPVPIIVVHVSGSSLANRFSSGASRSSTINRAGPLIKSTEMIASGSRLVRVTHFSLPNHLCCSSYR